MGTWNWKDEISKILLGLPVRLKIRLMRHMRIRQMIQTDLHSYQLHHLRYLQHYRQLLLGSLDCLKGDPFQLFRLNQLQHLLLLCIYLHLLFQKGQRMILLSHNQQLLQTKDRNTLYLMTRFQDPTFLCRSILGWGELHIKWGT